MQPEGSAIHYARMARGLPWNSDGRPGSSHDQSLTNYGQWAVICDRLARELPAFVIFTEANQANFSERYTHSHSAGNPLEIGRPLPVSGTCSPTINPIRIAAFLHQVAMPGKLKHLLDDHFIHLFGTPADRGIGKANILFRTRPQYLSSTTKTKSPQPTCPHTLNS